MEIEGVRLYDPRVKQFVKSNNPALILLDLITRTGCVIDEEFIIHFANVCDEKDIGMNAVIVRNTEKETTMKKHELVNIAANELYEEEKARRVNEIKVRIQEIRAAKKALIILEHKYNEALEEFIAELSSLQEELDTEF